MTSSEYPTDPQALPTGPAPRPELRRSRTDMMLGGVSGGLAEHTGIDALLWRVAFLGLPVAGGAGIPIYRGLGVLMPAAPAGPADKTNVLDEWVERLRGRLSSPRTTPAAG